MTGSRSQWAALAGVALLLAAAFVVRDGSAAPTAGPAGAQAAAASGESAAELAALREAADLAPCPAGLGPELPDLVLPCLGDGTEVALRSAPPGRPTLVNVWGTWCPPCVDEVPELVAFARRAGDRVAVVGVLTQDRERNGLEFARQFDVHYPNLVDGQGAVLRAFPPGPPVTLFLDPAGRVVHRKSGAFRDLAQLEAMVAEHLGVRL
jgi:cytochrome c biogenesis protein CcmG/thiol:disulfide interchange protein DsbE